MHLELLDQQVVQVVLVVQGQLVELGQLEQLATLVTQAVQVEQAPLGALVVLEQLEILDLLVSPHNIMAIYILNFYKVQYVSAYGNYWDDLLLTLNLTCHC